MKIPTTLYPAALTRNIYLAGIDIHTLIIELQRGLIDLKPWLETDLKPLVDIAKTVTKVVWLLMK